MRISCALLVIVGAVLVKNCASARRTRYSRMPQNNYENNEYERKVEQDSSPSEAQPAVAQADLPYPNYEEVPKGLSFTCKDKLPGYYADPETRCQVWHWCQPNGYQNSFLCPAQTVFNQAYRVCDWFYNVKCEEAPSLYDINKDLYRDAEGNFIKGK